MDYKNIILDDLNRENPTVPIVDPPLYQENDQPEDKIKALVRQMRRAKSLKDRIGTMLTAYYMGQVLEYLDEFSMESSKCLKLITPYYRTVAIRTYYLFEILGPEQIVRSRTCTLTMVSKIKEPTFLELVNEAVSIAGARI